MLSWWCPWIFEVIETSKTYQNNNKAVCILYTKIGLALHFDLARLTLTTTYWRYTNMSMIRKSILIDCLTKSDTLKLLLECSFWGGLLVKLQGSRAVAELAIIFYSAQLQEETRVWQTITSQKAGNKIEDSTVLWLPRGREQREQTK